MMKKGQKALVEGIFGAFYLVRPEGGQTVLKAKIRGRLRQQGHSDQRHPLCIGDRVLIEQQPDSDIEAVITEQLPRKNEISRSSSQHIQVLGANLDGVIIVLSIARPAFNRGFLDRTLVAAEMAGVQIHIAVNKADLDVDEKTAAERNQALYYAQLGYHLSFENFKTEISANLRQTLRSGQSFLLLGQSGVGKSTMINRIAGSDILNTGVVNSIGKGKHTTTNPVLIRIPDGPYLIDIPGVREFGLGFLTPKQAAAGFREFSALNCRFQDCLHQNEPDCGVKQALADGTLPPERYDSYISILESLVRIRKPRRGDFRRE